jgi:hypothetical protein
MLAVATQEAAAAEAAAAKQAELDAATARLAEAAGILNIKDELRETRWVFLMAGSWVEAS